MNNVITADDLIGKPILSRTSGNKLGEVEDLFIDPIKGLLMGLTIRNPQGHLGGLDYNDVYSFGADAIMANGDEKIVPLEDNWLAKHPHARKHLTGINIVSENGNLLGKVAKIYVRLMPPPVVIYEVADSVLDRWLGRDFFIPASAGTAISDNAERIVIPGDAARAAAPSLKALFANENAHLFSDSAPQNPSGANHSDNIASPPPASRAANNPAAAPIDDRFDDRLNNPVGSSPAEEETVLRQRNRF